MKLAFSTLGCPAWSPEKVIRMAAIYGFQGIEVRGIQDDLDITGRVEFTGQARATRQQLQDQCVGIVCFSSSVVLSSPDAALSEKSHDELKRYAQLCAVFGTPFIRIFGGKIGSTSRASALETAAANLVKMADIVKGSPTKILVETHDDWMHAEHLKALMLAVDNASIGLLWDVNHPFMFLGEAPAQTWHETGAWIHHTHWKDSKRDARAQHGFVPCLMGVGQVPHQEIYQVLKQGHYRGYLSLEWEKRWHPDIEEPDIAFPQYVAFMKKLLNLGL